MKSELIVDVQPSEVSIALLEDSRLMSLQKEARNISYAVGDIYIAKVKKLMPGLNAAFVNVGYEKDGFLHYLDLGAHFATYKEFIKKLLTDKSPVPSLSDLNILPDIDKHGSIAQQLQAGEEIMVQIVKEPISSKGPRLTTEIAFTGRFMVLVPFSDKISISQKIKTPEEKFRLKQLISSIKPKNFGVIVRTSAEGKRVAELINEMKTLLKCWEDTCSKCRKQDVPSLVYEEQSRIVGMLRDVFNPNFESIQVNDPDIAAQIRNYVSLIAPESTDIIKLYEKPEPIFDTFGVTRQIKSSFGKTVSFKSGAYIIIEHTEALHVIDVNSGNRTKADTDQETNALDVNLRAADEIARQLRLRDMGGIIVVDFIDMAKNEHRQQLYDHMKEVMANDRARHNILPLSKFGLMQITRQRVRPALDIATEESCPSCHGKETVKASLLFTDLLYDKLEYVCKTLNLNNFVLYIHPFVDAYIKKGWLMSLNAKWKRQLGHGFKIIPDESLAYLEYRIKDKDGNYIDVKEDKDTDSSTRSKKSAKELLSEVHDESEEKTETVSKQPTPTPPAANGRKARQRERQKSMKEAAEKELEKSVEQNPEQNEQKQADNQKEESRKEKPADSKVEKPVEKKSVKSASKKTENNLEKKVEKAGVKNMDLDEDKSAEKPETKNKNGEHDTPNRKRRHSKPKDTKTSPET